MRTRLFVARSSGLSFLQVSRRQHDVRRFRGALHLFPQGSKARARQVAVTYSTNHPSDVFSNEAWYYPRFVKMFVP